MAKSAELARSPAGLPKVNQSLYLGVLEGIAIRRKAL